jgi:tetratricopeptide (TPR) repeat protein
LLLVCLNISFSTETESVFDARVQEIGTLIQEQELALAQSAVEQFWAEHGGKEGFVEAVRRVKDQYWVNGQYAAHFDLCERVVKSFPNDPLSVGIQADLVTGYIHLNNLEAAAEKLDQFWSRYSDHPDFIEKLRAVNDVCWWTKNHDLYFSICQSVVEAFPDHPLSVGMLADQVAGYAILKETEKAFEKLDEFWELYSTFPDFVDKLLNIKNLCWWNENYPVHFAICERFIREFPGHPQAMQMGVDEMVGYIHRNELDTVAKKLDQYWTRYSAQTGFIEKLRAVNDVCWWTKNYDLYFSICRNVVEAFPDDPLSVGMLADQVAGYAILKETEKAFDKLDEFWERYSTAPDFVDKLLNIKNLCWWNENYPVHFAICERVARELPYHPMTMQIRKDTITGYIFVNESALAEEKLYQFLIDYAGDERMAVCLDEIARLYNEKGYYQEGETLYRYVLNLKSQDGKSPVMTLAGILVSQIGKNEAFAVIEAQVDDLIVRYADDPNLAEAVFMVGEGYALKGQALRKSGSLQNEKEASPTFLTPAVVESVDYRIALLESVILDSNAFNDPNFPSFAEAVLWEPDTIKTDYANQTGYAQSSIESYLGALKIWDISIFGFQKLPFAPQAAHYSAEIYRTLNDNINAALYYQYLVHKYPDYIRSEECSYLVIHSLEQAFNKGCISGNKASALIAAACDHFENSYPEPAALMQIAKKKQRWSRFLSDGKERRQ